MADKFKPFLAKDGDQLVVSEHVTVEHNAIRVVSIGDRPNDKVTDTEIILDGYSVQLDDHEKELLPLLRENELIPKLYVVRTKETSRFVCGFDLMEGGSYWVGIQTDVNVHGVQYDRIQDVLAVVARHLNDEPFYLCLEDAFPI